MPKSGQVTAFIILGIVIITVVAAAFYFRNQLISLGFSSGREESITIPTQLRPVKNHIDNCLREISIEGIYQIGRQGGYYNAPVESSIIYFTESVPYYYLNNQEIIPSIRIIEKELASYISDNLIACLNFKDFIDNGFKIRQGNYTISTAINDNNVDIRMYYPIKIEKSGISIVLKEYTSGEYFHYFITTDEFSEYYRDHNLPVSGLAYLGTDVAGDPGEQRRLREGGFWPESLEVVTSREFRQEQGTQTIPGNFNSLQDGLVGMAGILAERKKTFLDDFRRKFGEGELKRLSEEEISFWTYFYYNCGQGCGKGHLYGEEFVTGGNKRKGVGRENAFSKLSSDEPSCSSCPDPKVNALRRLATQEWLEQSAVFEVEPTTKKI